METNVSPSSKSAAAIPNAAVCITAKCAAACTSCRQISGLHYTTHALIHAVSVTALCWGPVVRKAGYQTAAGCHWVRQAWVEQA
jgi:hypothetical protein